MLCEKHDHACAIKPLFFKGSAALYSAADNICRGMTRKLGQESLQASDGSSRWYALFIACSDSNQALRDSGGQENHLVVFPEPLAQVRHKLVSAHMEHFGAMLYCVQECVRIIGVQCSPALHSERLCRWRTTAVFSNASVDATAASALRRHELLRSVSVRVHVIAAEWSQSPTSVLRRLRSLGRVHADVRCYAPDPSLVRGIKASHEDLVGSTHIIPSKILHSPVPTDSPIQRPL